MEVRTTMPASSQSEIPSFHGCQEWSCALPSTQSNVVVSSGPLRRFSREIYDVFAENVNMCSHLETSGGPAPSSVAPLASALTTNVAVATPSNSLLGVAAARSSTLVAVTQAHQATGTTNGCFVVYVLAGGTTCVCQLSI